MPKYKDEGKTWEELTNEVAADRGLSNDKDFKEWFKTKENIGYLFDTRMTHLCYNIHKKLNNDFDWFMVIAAGEGLGKSTLGIQVCSYIDPNFNKDRICYSGSQFLNAMKDSPRGSAILADEGGQFLFSREAMSWNNKMIIKSGMIMRQRNLCVVIAIPNFHLLDSYIKLHRVKTLIQIYERGNYIGFLDRGISKIAQDGAKYKNVLGIDVDSMYKWPGYFRKDFPKTISRNEYLAQKESNMIEFLNKMMEDNELFETKMVSAARVAKEIGCTSETIRNSIVRGKIIGKQIGSKWYITKEEYYKLICDKK